ncbi:glycosyltransferase involved in cell wall biosynthesis [Pseudoclavibacter sp. JAI123]|uniref:glycosyltransferase n=1 Tax=Pseudoclavibacter sp. JAI123 TaxID=2723065 RepID=UPI0015C947A8|nr:glycosyltransferase [Pseudoclavibacter sp. JAI123]NYF13014.1 glycosyltransferase involved in cell wall biosynthesis [Pseudoclavibacter sp. JAI123]
MSSPSSSDVVDDLSRTIRIASVPAGHVYVRHLSAVTPDPSLAAILRLPDPHPDGSARVAAERWWPPVMLEPSWIEQHADEFDVFHVHFGFDALAPDVLTELVDALRREGKPLVYTVHDLTNPHHATPEAHLAHLDILIPAADELITLTEGAADEVERRWGRRPVVIPHPHIVEPAEVETALAERVDTRGEFHVGVHAKSLRASMEPLPVIEALVELARVEPSIVVHVNGHREILEPGGAKFEEGLASRLRELADAGHIELRIHDYLSDEELWRYLASLDASVLPYRFGTHSGWMEACLDLGTTVIAPDVGFYADQGPVFTYRRAADALDARSLRDAVLAASRAVAPRHAPEFRASQRDEIAAAHADIYAAVLTRVRVTQ